MPNHITLKGIQINGFATKNVHPGEGFWALIRASLTSDQPEFHVFMKSITGVITKGVKDIGGHLPVNGIIAFVLVAHDSDSSDLYINDIPMALEVLGKKDFAAGEVVYQSGIADIRRVKFPNITFQDRDRVICCFKVGWKFGLFFDIDHDRSLDVDKMERDLGALYRTLSFQEVYDAMSTPAIFEKLVKAGWFPFVEIVGGEFEKLLKAYESDFNISAEEEALVKRFDANRMKAIAERWWKRPALSGKRTILESAFAAFERKDPVSCLKIILTEIEGIIQGIHITETGKDTSVKELLKFATEKGMKKTGDESSLLLPKRFIEYMSECTYAPFDSKDPKDDQIMSRHSTGHGGASAEAYTQVRALQAILTLDQLAFYL